MITPADVLAAGYRADRIDNYVADNTAYFKWIERQGVRLYSIQVTFWYFDKHFRDSVGTRVNSKAHLYLGHEDQLVEDSGFTLELSLQDSATVFTLEAFYERAYDALRCCPDLHNQR
jgi:hypothetical protein